MISFEMIMKPWNLLPIFNSKKITSLYWWLVSSDWSGYKNQVGIISQMHGLLYRDYQEQVHCTSLLLYNTKIWEEKFCNFTRGGMHYLCLLNNRFANIFIEKFCIAQYCNVC